MKICRNCNCEYEDNVNFCPQCGSKLESDKFCSNCGKKLSPDAKFCPECGAKVELIQSKPLPKKLSTTVAEPRKNSTTNWNYILKISFLALFAIISVLFLVGSFGRIVEVRGPNLTDLKYDIDYFFGKGVERLNNIKNSYKYGEYYSYSLGIFVIHNITYFGGLLSLFCFLTIGLYKNYKIVSQKLDIDFEIKWFLFAALSILPYVVITSMYFLAEAYAIRESIGVEFGWGVKLLFSALISTFASIILSELIVSVQKKKFFASELLGRIAMLILMIMAVVGPSKFIKADLVFSDGISTVNVVSQSNVLNTIDATLSAYSGDVIKKLPDNYVWALSGAIFMVIFILSAIGTIALLYFKKRKLYTVSVTLSFVSFLVSVIFEYFYADANRSMIYSGFTNAKVSLGDSAIIGIVFLTIAVILVVIGGIIGDKKTKGNETEPSI